MNAEFQWMPEQASSVAADVDAVYLFLVAVSGVLTLIIAFLIVYFAIKYRRGSPADRRLGPSHFYVMELSWIALPLVVSTILFFWGANIFLHQMRPPSGAMEIQCVARQWMWKFQHPEGAAEINDLHVPIGQPIKVKLISEDVIHSLYIPAFRVKQDVLPGRYTSVWFEPTRAGRYHLFCAEYCGAKHSEMRGTVHVLEPNQYQEWLAGKSTGPAQAEGGASLFEQFRCNTCHLGGGMCGRGPSLAGIYGKSVTLEGGRTVVADDNYLRESMLRPAAKIVAGYQPLMPSYEGQIGEEAILQLIAEIKSMSASANQPPTSPTTPATPPTPMPQP